MVAGNEPWDANIVFGTTDGGQHWQPLADKSKVDVAYFRRPQLHRHGDRSA